MEKREAKKVNTAAHIYRPAHRRIPQPSAERENNE